MGAQGHGHKKKLIELIFYSFIQDHCEIQHVGKGFMIAISRQLLHHPGVSVFLSSLQAIFSDSQ